jgi:hypothetical protein
MSHSQVPMNIDAASADERRLHDQKQHPAGEDGPVNVEQLEEPVTRIASALCSTNIRRITNNSVNHSFYSTHVFSLQADGRHPRLEAEIWQVTVIFYSFFFQKAPGSASGIANTVTARCGPREAASAALLRNRPTPPDVNGVRKLAAAGVARGYREGSRPWLATQPPFMRKTVRKRTGPRIRKWRMPFAGL